MPLHSDNLQSSIRTQVRLPLTVAFDVVMQGIRIRLGRSVITLLGVVLGIAFLMAILTGQSLRRGVAEEAATRTELRRMLRFLTADTGDLAGSTLAVVQAGPLSVLEQRFLREVDRTGVARLNWVAPATPPGGATFTAEVAALAPARAGAGAGAVLIMGAGAPPTVDWPALLGDHPQTPVAVTRQALAAAAGTRTGLVVLERELDDDERAQVARDARRARYRTAWIIVISLLVTVIGISNAMLMSVTERFREIGTMKCLGALAAFIRHVFFIESSLMGFVGAAVGSLVGVAFAASGYAITYGLNMVLAALDPWRLLAHGALCLVAGIVLSVVAAIYPASYAARMVPADALRSNI